MRGWAGLEIVGAGGKVGRKEGVEREVCGCAEEGVWCLEGRRRRGGRYLVGWGDGSALLGFSHADDVVVAPIRSYKILFFFPQEIWTFRPHNVLCTHSKGDDDDEKEEEEEESKRVSINCAPLVFICCVSGLRDRYLKNTE